MSHTHKSKHGGPLPPPKNSHPHGGISSLSPTPYSTTNIHRVSSHVARTEYTPKTHNTHTYGNYGNYKTSHHITRHNSSTLPSHSSARQLPHSKYSKTNLTHKTSKSPEPISSKYSTHSQRHHHSHNSHNSHNSHTHHIHTQSQNDIFNPAHGPLTRSVSSGSPGSPSSSSSSSSSQSNNVPNSSIESENKTDSIHSGRYGRVGISRSTSDSTNNSNNEERSGNTTPGTHIKGSTPRDSANWFAKVQYDIVNYQVAFTRSSFKYGWKKPMDENAIENIPMSLELFQRCLKRSFKCINSTRQTPLEYIDVLYNMIGINQDGTKQDTLLISSICSQFLHFNDQIAINYSKRILREEFQKRFHKLIENPDDFTKNQWFEQKNILKEWFDTNARGINIKTDPIFESFEKDSMTYAYSQFLVHKKMLDILKEVSHSIKINSHQRNTSSDSETLRTIREEKIGNRNSKRNSISSTATTVSTNNSHTLINSSQKSPLSSSNGLSSNTKTKQTQKQKQI